MSIERFKPKRLNANGTAIIKRLMAIFFDWLTIFFIFYILKTDSNECEHVTSFGAVVTCKFEWLAAIAQIGTNERESSQQVILPRVVGMIVGDRNSLCRMAGKLGLYSTFTVSGLYHPSPARRHFHNLFHIQSGKRQAVRNFWASSWGELNSHGIESR